QEGRGGDAARRLLPDRQVYLALAVRLALLVGLDLVGPGLQRHRDLPALAGRQVLELAVRARAIDVDVVGSGRGVDHPERRRTGAHRRRLDDEGTVGTPGRDRLPA